jgi:hypothetical protein
MPHPKGAGRKPWQVAHLFDLRLRCHNQKHDQAVKVPAVGVGPCLANVLNERQLYLAIVQSGPEEILGGAP